MHTTRKTHLSDPRWCLLFTPQNPFCAYDSSLRVYRAVEHVDCEDMGAVWIWVFMPHPNDHMRPRMAFGDELAIDLDNDRRAATYL